MAYLFRPNPAKAGPWLLLALAILVVDQVTKAWIAGAFQLGESNTITEFFNLTRVHNQGAAFSFLASETGWQRWLFIAIGVLAMAVISWMLHNHASRRLLAFALACILGGAVGNVIDRVLRGHVVDFLQFHFAGWYFPAFNVADSAITIGAAVLILDEVRRMRRPG